MAHPYDTRAGLDAVAGGGQSTAIVFDLNGDGVEDAGTYEAFREQADAEIDARLAQKFSTPFGTLSTTDASLIATISNNLTIGHAYGEQLHPGDPKSRYHIARAESLLERLLDGTFDLPSAAKVAAGTGRRALSYDADEPTCAGRDSSGKSRMSSW